VYLSFLAAAMLFIRRAFWIAVALSARNPLTLFRDVDRIA
jgi:hypothetical protein